MGPMEVQMHLHTLHMVVVDHLDLLEPGMEVPICLLISIKIQIKLNLCWHT